MVEVMESEYVTMARLKGLPNRVVIWRHAVPNAIVPAIQVSALQLAYMAGGVVVVENVFSSRESAPQLVDAVGQPRRAGGAGAASDHRRRVRDREPGRRHDHDRRHPAAEDGGPDEPTPPQSREESSRRSRGRCRSSARRDAASRQWLSLLGPRSPRWRARIGLVLSSCSSHRPGGAADRAPLPDCRSSALPNGLSRPRPVRHRQPRPRRVEPVPLRRAHVLGWRWRRRSSGSVSG